MEIERVLGIASVTIGTNDPEGLAAWYARHLGIQFNFHWLVGPAANLSTGETLPGAPFLYFDSRPKPTGIRAWFAPRAPTCELCYLVRDLQAMLEQLQTVGVQVDYRDENLGPNAPLVAKARDREGNWFGLIQFPRGG
jgi:hypothetical protein